jgi:hypothetical protein
LAELVQVIHGTTLASNATGSPTLQRNRPLAARDIKRMLTGRTGRLDRHDREWPESARLARCRAFR